MELTRIFLDACIIIYWVESAEPFYSKLLTQFNNIAEQYPEHVLTISRLSFLECLVKPTREKDKKTIDIYRDLFESAEIEIIEMNEEVINIATQLRADYGLRMPDAIQAASCLSSNESHVFLTNDKRFASVTCMNVVTL